ncbi:hypothetical protein J6590_102012 [Homalodisca vitripennis]|nr:hypothetical protein J6590_102012 [Homalodisca vitripennis]
MAFFTGEDEDNLKRLVDNHRVIYRRNALLSRAPHLGTHTTLRVKACTDEDPVHLPPTSDSQAEARRDMEDMAIVADWTFTRTGCDHMVSCNPFYPQKKRCSGMVRLTPGGERRVVGSPEDPFSFVTLENQSFDVCQPICYDEAVSLDNLVGVMSRFAFGKCRVYDPLLLALYLDPSRRYVNPETQILERKAFAVRDVLIEPYGDAALLASIPTDYCEQYGEKYEADGSVQGIDVFKCGDHALVWSTSWLIGESVPRLTLLSLNKALEDSEPGEETIARRPPSVSFLKSRANWLENKVKGKRPVPFPLRLTDLGITRGTNTEWLVWTDEFAHLTDGRNDRYGGRLVERDRPVSPSIRSRSRTAAAAVAATLRNTSAGGRVKRRSADKEYAGDDGGRVSVDDVRFRSVLLKSLKRGMSEYASALEAKAKREGFDFSGLGAGLTYGATYEYLGHKHKLPTAFSALKSAFRAVKRAPDYAKKMSLKTICSWAVKSASVHSIESTVTRTLVQRLKTLTALQVLGPIGMVIDLISLFGTALDISFVVLKALGVSTPLSRRENVASDRRLHRLAQAEIEFNYRLYGVGNVELTPFQFVVNTPYVTAEEDMESYMALMPIAYTARELNSHGGRLRPDRVAGDDFELDRNGFVKYVIDGSSDRAGTGDDEVGKVGGNVQHDPTPYYVTLLFLTICLLGFFYPNTRWTIAPALIFSVLSLLFNAEASAETAGLRTEH